MLTLQAAVYKEPQVMRHTQAPSKRQENSDENYLTSKKHLQLCKEMPCGHVAQKALAAPAVGFLRSLQFGASPPALRIIASRTTDCNYIYFFSLFLGITDSVYHIRQFGSQQDKELM